MKKLVFLFLISANMFGQSKAPEMIQLMGDGVSFSNVGTSTGGNGSLTAMKDGDSALAYLSNAEDKLVSSHFSLLDIFSSTELIIFAFPLVLLVLFVLSNLSFVGKLIKSFFRWFIGQFIRLEEDNPHGHYKIENMEVKKKIIRGLFIENHHELNYESNNCNSCGANKWYGNMCGYCGSTYKIK